MSNVTESAKKDTSAGGDHDVADALGGLSLGGGSARAAGAALVTGAGDMEYRYRMDRRRRGRFIIINNKTFLPKTRMNARKGTDVDADNLEADFERLGFEVVRHRDQTVMQMMQLMLDEGAKDHSDCDCFAVAVLTHGDNGKLLGVDSTHERNTLGIDNFLQPIKNCGSLVGKPKIFICQACRGNEMDPGKELEAHDSTAEHAPRRIPFEADFLYVYSTVPGYYSWRNSGNGSWFIQALHTMMARYQQLDFVTLLTRVNHEVAYNFESYSTEDWMKDKKQVPSIVSMLTKDLFLTPK